MDQSGISNLAPVEVDNPYSLAGEAKEKIVAMRNLRGDPLGWMHSKGLPDALYIAGRAWQELYERAEIGAIKAFDMTRDPVDGSGAPRELISDQQMRAAKLLNLATQNLERSGRGRVRLIQLILGQRLFPSQIAALKGEAGEAGAKRVSREFRKALDILSRLFSFSG